MKSLTGNGLQWNDGLKPACMKGSAGSDGKEKE